MTSDVPVKGAYRNRILGKDGDLMAIRVGEASNQINAMIENAPGLKMDLMVAGGVLTVLSGPVGIVKMWPGARVKRRLRQA